jgi:macrolide transport system ATP-binding/permease protein
VPLLRLSGVGKSYPSGDGELHVLQDIDLVVHAGEMLAIVGQSGSGKSTLMHILGCLDRPGTGSYQVRGVETRVLDPDELAALRREHFGFIFQRYHLLGHLSAIENVAVPAAYLGVGPDARRARARELLAKLGLEERGDNRPSALSGGQQQRVSIARALMNGGEVIFADEPTGALDKKSGADVMAILRELHQLGHTIIIVTHDMKVAAAAERIVEISDGRIISDRPVERATVPGAVIETASGAMPGSALSPDKRDAAQYPMPHAVSDPSSGASHAVTWRRSATEAVSAAWSMMARHRLRTALTMLSMMIRPP